MPELVLTFESSAHIMECCKASQFSNDAGARIWQAADVGYLALQYGAWLTWVCLTLQLSSHLVPLLLQESSLHFLSFFVKTFLVYFYICTIIFKFQFQAQVQLLLLPLQAVQVHVCLLVILLSTLYWSCIHSHTL